MLIKQNRATDNYNRWLSGKSLRHHDEVEILKRGAIGNKNLRAIYLLEKEPTARPLIL